MFDITKYGYQSLVDQDIEEIDAKLHVYIHQKTGLKFYWLERDDDNKTFTIAFKTTPKDDTGVFHILEHSVLGGSQKYPLKEPFLDLLKGSLNTFLNAMTYPDKTLYPVSSRNDKDFMNLVSVYVDAVFAPMILEKEEIFYQEGWRYDFSEDKPQYTGVVYSEMRGVMADIDEIETDAINKELFKDTAYAYNSGGDPEHIIDLSYDEFIATYKKFYHPSNAYVLVDGKVDIEKVMALLDEYLKGKDKGITIDNSALFTSYKGPKTITMTYPKSGESDRYRIVYGMIVSRFDDIFTQYAVSILDDVLCGHNEAPLKKAILQSGLAEDISIYMIDGVAEPWLKMEVKNVDKEDIDKVDKLIHDTLSGLVVNGIDKAKIKAAIAASEFANKERDFGTSPDGLIYIILMLESILYGGEPDAKLSTERYFKKMKEGLDDNLFEKLLDDIYLHNEKTCKIIFEPSEDYNALKEKAMADRLERELSSLSEEELTIYKEKDQKTLIWQSEDDPKEIKDLLPKLTLADISKDPIPLPTEVTKLDDVTLLKHNINTSGIYHTSMYFDIDGLGKEDLGYLRIFSLLLGKLKTEKYSADELALQLSLYVGSSNITITPYQDLNDPKNAKTKFVVSFSALKENYQKAKEIMMEVLLKTKIDESTIEDIQKIMTQLKMGMKQRFSSQSLARTIAATEVYATYSKIGVINDVLSGISFYDLICDIDLDKLITKVNEVRSYIAKKDLIITITGDKIEDDCIGDLLKVIKEKSDKPNEEIDLYPKKNKGIIVPSDVSSVVMGYDLSHILPYKGSYQVAMKILSLDHLWNEVRRKGGAYGTGASILATDYVSSFSTSDPNAKRTLSIFKGQADYIKDNIDSFDIPTSIIGTIADNEPLMSPRVKSSIADRNYIIGLSFELRQKTRAEILDTKRDDLLAIADALKAAQDEAVYCVVGPKDVINKIDVDETIEVK